MKRIIVAGHICIDITPVIPEKKGAGIEDIFTPGKLIQTGAAKVNTGGTVANTGLALKVLGADAVLMGKVGCDDFGDMICNILRKYDADQYMIHSAEVSSSYSVVLAVPGIDRIFLHNPGANDTFCAADVDTGLLKDASLFHFGYPPLMRTMYANEGAELVALMERVKEASVATSLDMAAIDADTEAGRTDWDIILQKVLPFVDFFVPSVEELCFMLERKRFAEWQERAGNKAITDVLDIEKDVKPLADRCMEYGAKVVLIKCGAPGMYYRTAGEKRLKQIGCTLGGGTAQWAEQEGFEASYIPERVLSGTGAGDTSIAAFLMAVSRGESLEDCLHMATAAGASCVTAYDALGGLMPYEALKQKVKSGWEKRPISFHA